MTINALHNEWRATVRRFVQKEIAPFVDEWDEAGGFPRELYQKAAAIGILGMGYEERYGGVEADLTMRIIASEELAQVGSGGLKASLFSHTIGLPPIAKWGSTAMKARVMPQVLSGEKISALAITEPSGGSDVAQLKTTAVVQGDHYVVNGSKMFITSGVRADYYTVAVRTGGPGAAGVSLLLVERGMAGFTQQPLKKMGWWMSDTAQLFFDNVRVPASNLIGAENQGFKLIMHNFNSERLLMSVGAAAFAQVCYDEAKAWAQERQAFGGPLSEKQVIRHKLVDMQMKVTASKAWIASAVAHVEAQERERPTREEAARLVADLCMLKNFTTQTMQHCADQAVQILGGMGFMRGTKCERIYREVKVNMIGGGAEEVMKDLAARQLGI